MSESLTDNVTILLPISLFIGIVITSIIVGAVEEDILLHYLPTYIALLLPSVFFLIYSFELKERKHQYAVLVYAVVYVVLYYLSFDHYFILFAYFFLAYLTLIIVGFLPQKDRDKT